MLRKVRHLLNRDGRLFARLVIPKGLRPFLGGKTELRAPLGSDHRAALRAIPGAIALLQHKIAQAERKAAEADGKPAVRGRYPLDPEQLAQLHCLSRLALDDYSGNVDHRYAHHSPAAGASSDFQPLRDAISGKLDDRELNDLMGDRVERY